MISTQKMKKSQLPTKHSCPYPAKAGYVSYAGRSAQLEKNEKVSSNKSLGTL